jgi:hypothetical protein
MFSKMKGDEKMKSKKKKAIAWKDIKRLLEALNWENPMIEKIVKLADKKKATRYHGMLLVALTFCSFLTYRFCSKIAFQILMESGMPEKEINYFLNFYKNLDTV